MRVTKAILGIGLLVGLAFMWTSREYVIDAYANEGQASTDLRLEGIDLDVELSPIEPSPYEVLEAPDTRRVPVVLAFDDGEIIEPEPPETTIDPLADPDSLDNVVDTTIPTTTRPRETVPPPPIHGGTAKLEGTVMGPEGPVPFATVRLERHTSDGLAVKDITADSNGKWSADRLLGGRYRVRSWAKGLLTMTESHVFFLAEAETLPLAMQLSEIAYEPMMNLVDGGNIYLGLTGSIAVSVTFQTVDEDGLIVVSGLPGAIVTLYPSAGITATPQVAVADTDGVARFTLRCHDLGSKTALVQHQEDVRPFALPSCIPIPPPPTTQPPTTQPPTVEGSPVPGQPTTTTTTAPVSNGVSNG